MNPNPLRSLNHLTVPFIFTETLLSSTATLSYVVGPQNPAGDDMMMKRNRQDEGQLGMTGSLERQHRSRNPSLFSVAQHLPWRFKSCQAILWPRIRRSEVDKPRPLTYSVAPG